MISLKKASLLAAAYAMLVPAATFAAAPHDVVKDKRGNVVLNTFSNCVETKWESKTDECAGKNKRPFSKLTREQRTVYFDFNKSTLNSKEKAKLDDVSKILLSSKEVESVDIVGYADKIGKSSYNKKLSLKRAETVKSYLGGKGLKTRNVRVEGMGEANSVTKCEDSMERSALISCLAQDRRVEIEVNVKQ